MQKKNWKKALVFDLYVAVFTAVCIAVLAVVALSTPAHADSVIIVDEYEIEPCIVDNEVVLKITFNYEGELLSFYWWNEPLRSGASLWAHIDRYGTELVCDDADYLERW